MLKPLEQFICDECGEVIEDPKDGFVEWVYDGKAAYGFRIVHVRSVSPYKNVTGCFKYTDYKGRSDVPLSDYLRTKHQKLYSLLDIGDILDPDGLFKIRIADFREYVDFARRITIPYYEEARLYLNQAIGDGFLDPGGNEVRLYMEDVLKSVVEEYSEL